jgi:hypothetical protein
MMPLPNRGLSLSILRMNQSGLLYQPLSDLVNFDGSMGKSIH